MGKGRLEAFSDGVIAIIITIMVLELRPPHGADFGSLVPLAPTFLSYALSFVFVAIYWNNHHHMLQVARSVTGPILWANTHLLFWLSMVPFATAWMGENHLEAAPVALYGMVLLMNGVAYTILAALLTRHEGQDSALALAFGRDIKGKLSMVIYAAGVILAFVSPYLAIGLYFAVAMMWIVPDRRIERRVRAGG
jgi:uncharacterized membrane protein